MTYSIWNICDPLDWTCWLHGHNRFLIETFESVVYNRRYDNVLPTAGFAPCRSNERHLCLYANSFTRAMDMFSCQILAGDQMVCTIFWLSKFRDLEIWGFVRHIFIVSHTRNTKAYFADELDIWDVLNFIFWMLLDASFYFTYCLPTPSGVYFFRDGEQCCV